MQALQCVTFANAIAMGVAFAAAPVYAQAQQKFPTKPIRFVVGYVPGAQSDTLARIIGAKMGENWGQPVVVENRPAAVGTLAAVTVAKGIADG